MPTIYYILTAHYPHPAATTPHPRDTTHPSIPLDSYYTSDYTPEY